VETLDEASTSPMPTLEPITGHLKTLPEDNSLRRLIGVAGLFKSFSLSLSLDATIFICLAPDESIIRFRPVVASTPARFALPLNADDSGEGALPTRIALSDLLADMAMTISNRTTNTTRITKNALRSSDHTQGTNERLNRTNFFLKNIRSSRNHLDVFTSIATMFPLVEMNVTNVSPKIQYLCVSGNIKTYSQKEMLPINHTSRFFVDG
jgi:hypothetical protein